MFFKKLSITVAAVLLMSVLFSACGNKKEEDSLKRVVDSGKLTVVGSGGYRPFNYIDENGEVIGFDVDTGKEIAKRLGVELSYVTGDWNGLLEGLRNGRYDGILGSMAITEERLEVVDFTIPYYYSGAQLIVRTDSGITDPSQMKDKSIAVTIGTNFVQDAEALGAKVSFYDDDNATIMELINGRVDGVITDRLVAVEAMGKINGGDQLMFAGEVMRLEEMAIAINKNDKELLDKINEILTQMHEDGTLKKISENWHNGADITVK